MAGKKRTAGGKEDSTDRQLTILEKQLRTEVELLQKARGGMHCYPLLLSAAHIGPRLVDDTFEELQKSFSKCDGKLDVLLDSPGGDIDSAYNLGQLLRRYATKELNFIIPRWAKSAATLLACSGDRILMTPVAELGPMDPQITEVNPFEGRLETYSPLHIDSTLDLIRKEFDKGNRDLAQALMQRLQFPLTLGSIRKSLDIAKQYLDRLLASRMLRNISDSAKRAAEIAKRLTEDYADHGFCINVEEARNIGLVTEELQGDQLLHVWRIHRLSSKRSDYFKKKREQEMREKIKNIPPEILEKLPIQLQQQLIPGGDYGTR
jgi:hypothetical protein